MHTSNTLKHPPYVIYPTCIRQTPSTRHLLYMYTSNILHTSPTLHVYVKHPQYVAYSTCIRQTPSIRRLLYMYTSNILHTSPTLHVYVKHPPYVTYSTCIRQTSSNTLHTSYTLHVYVKHPPYVTYSSCIRQTPSIRRLPSTCLTAYSLWSTCPPHPLPLHLPVQRLYSYKPSHRVKILSPRYRDELPRMRH